MLKKSRYLFLLGNNLVWHSLLGKSVRVSGVLYDKLGKDVSFDDDNSAEVQKLISYKFISQKDTDDNVLYDVKEKIADTGLNNLFLIMTNSCNLRCKYCFYQNTKSLQNKMMTFQVAKKAVDIFIQNQDKNEQTQGWFSQITFYGGEPLLNFECIKKITDYIEQLKFEKRLSEKTQLVINTNGTLINDDIVKWAKQHSVQVQISIDGNEAQHDKNRITTLGEGSYKNTLKGLEFLVKNKIDILPLITVTEDNLPQLEDIIYQLCKDYHLKHYGMNLLIDLGKQPIGDYPKYASEKMVETCKKTSELSVSDDAVDMIFDILKNFRVAKQTCGVSRKMTVFPDGKILSCQAISDCEKSLIGHVDTGLTENENIKYWKNYTRFNNQECLSCKYLGICGGGCVASALFRHKQLGKVDKHYCYWIKNIMEKYFNPEDYLME